MRVQPRARSRSRFAALCALALACALVLASGAPGQDLQAELDSKRAELDQRQEQEGVLSTELSRYEDQLAQLAGEVAVLRNREAIVQAELDEVQARLRDEKARLESLRRELDRSLGVLRQRLVSIYKSDEPDVLTVILDAKGFDDLIERYEYLRRIEEQDTLLVDRVRGLRDESRGTVTRIEEARDEIRDKKAELERTRMQLEAREAELDAVRDRKAAALDSVRSDIDRLEGDVSELSAEIEKRLRAEAASTTTAPLPAGPVQGGSSGYVWPVDAVLTSPFGPRWGRLHAGLDLAAPGGTPIRATRSGTVTMAEYYGGYGNYTCIDHGGGVTSCYAHQSALGTTAGASVKTGEVMGYVGTTGASTGNHLHFEIRVNGTPVDPMGYL